MDPDAYWHPYVIPYPHVVEETKPVKAYTHIEHIKTVKSSSAESVFKVERLIDLIVQERIDITGKHSDWIKIGFALVSEFGEKGRKYFHEISQFYYAYSSEETDAQYSKCLKYNNNKITIGTVSYIHSAYRW